jgi:type IV pilus assembly protein PilB
MPAQPAESMRLPALARKMVEAGLLDEDKAQKAIEASGKKGRTLTSHVVREKLVDAMGFAHLAAEDFGMPLIDLSAVDLRHAPTDAVSEDLLRKHLIVPIMKRGKRLFVAAADPGNKSAIDEISLFHGPGGGGRAGPLQRHRAGPGSGDGRARPRPSMN